MKLRQDSGGECLSAVTADALCCRRPCRGAVVFAAGKGSLPQGHEARVAGGVVLVREEPPSAPLAIALSLLVSVLACQVGSQLGDVHEDSRTMRTLPEGGRYSHNAAGGRLGRGRGPGCAAEEVEVAALSRARLKHTAGVSTGPF